MRALIALTAVDREEDLWSGAFVISASADLVEHIEGEHHYLDTDHWFEVLGWPSHPAQPGMLVWEAEYEPDAGILPEGHCRLLTLDEWAMVADGRMQEVVE